MLAVLLTTLLREDAAAVSLEINGLVFAFLVGPSLHPQAQSARKKKKSEGKKEKKNSETCQLVQTSS